MTLRGTLDSTGWFSVGISTSKKAIVLSIAYECGRHLSSTMYKALAEKTLDPWPAFPQRQPSYYPGKPLEAYHQTRTEGHEGTSPTKAQLSEKVW